MARFQREAHVAAHLNHPNIARVLSSGEEQGTFWIASEFIEGVELGALLKSLRKAMTLEMFFAIALPVLEALEYAHQVKGAEGAPLHLVHRDLAPKNIMVTYAGEVKVIDFGIAHAELDRFKTQTGMLIGTPGFLSPEQALGERIDHRSDLFSISAVFFEMLSGKPLIERGLPLVQMLHAIISLVPPKLSMVNPAIPPALDELIARGLSTDRERRWTSAQALLDAFKALKVSPCPQAQLSAVMHRHFAGRIEACERWRIQAAEYLQTEQFEDPSAAALSDAATRLEVLPEAPPLAKTFVLAPSAGAHPLGFKAAALLMLLMIGLGALIIAALNPEQAPQEIVLAPRPSPSIAPGAPQTPTAVQKRALLSAPPRPTKPLRAAPVRAPKRPNRPLTPAAPQKTAPPKPLKRQLLDELDAIEAAWRTHKEEEKQYDSLEQILRVVQKRSRTQTQPILNAEAALKRASRFKHKLIAVRAAILSLDP